VGGLLLWPSQPKGEQARRFSQSERLEEALMGASSAARLLLQCLLSKLEPPQMEVSIFLYMYICIYIYIYLYKHIEIEREEALMGASSAARLLLQCLLSKLEPPPMEVIYMQYFI